jgi:hypothetical protein
MAKLNVESVPNKLRDMCADFYKMCWYGNSLEDDLCRVVCRVDVDRRKRSFYFCFSFIDGDWLFKSLMLLDKKIQQWYIKEGLTNEDFKGIWKSIVRFWRIMPTKKAIGKYGMIKTDSVNPLDDFCRVPEEVKPTYKERFPVPAGFLEQLKYTIKKAYYVSLKSRSEGLLKLEDDIGYEDGREDIFNYGLQFAIDGTDSKYIDKVLSNLIEYETDLKMKLLKIIQKEAVLSIQKGDNIRLLIMLIVSYVDDETLKWLKGAFEDDEGIKRFLR